MRRFNGIMSAPFYWFLKECEWRFNGCNHKELLTKLNSGIKEEKTLTLAMTALIFFLIEQKIKVLLN